MSDSNNKLLMEHFIRIEKLNRQNRESTEITMIVAYNQFSQYKIVNELKPTDTIFHKLVKKDANQFCKNIHEIVMRKVQNNQGEPIYVTRTLETLEIQRLMSGKLNGNVVSTGLPDKLLYFDNKTLLMEVFDHATKPGEPKPYVTFRINLIVFNA